MARTQSYVSWTLERRIDLLRRRADADVPGKTEAAVRHGGLCSLVGCEEGGSPAAAGAVEGEGGYRRLVDGGKKIPFSPTPGGDGGSDAITATAKVAVAKWESSHYPPVVKPEPVLPATVKNRTCLLHAIPKGDQGPPPAIFREPIRVAPPLKRTSAAPYASMDLATRLVMAKRWARETKACRQIVPVAATAGFAEGRGGCTKALSLTQGQKRGAPSLCLQWKKPKLEAALDARRTVEQRLREFRDLTAKFQRQNEMKPDMAALRSLKACGRTPDRKYLGEVPGVEVGDEFYYRSELMVAGVHTCHIAGIDSGKFGSNSVATCVVSHKFRGYVNFMTDDDVLEYSGQGGNPFFESTRKKVSPRDQKLEGGNLALKNSMAAATPVRVVHGFKVDDGGELPGAETNSTVRYIYDGLYMVEKFWWEMGPREFMVLKFQMRRLPGQRRLELKQVLRARAAGSKQVLTATASGTTELLLTAADQTCDLDAPSSLSRALVRFPIG